MFRAPDAVKFLFVLVTVLGTTVACGKSPPKDRPNPFVVSGVYDVNAVSLNCADGNRCTNSLGIILTVHVETKSYRYYKTTTTSVSRCTGALYSPTQVLTAGHCTQGIGTGRSFFKTVATAGMPSRIFEIKGVAKSYYSEANSFSSDYATLELKTPANGYKYVRAAGFISPSLNEVTALVVNQPSDDSKVFQLDNVDCEVDAETLPLHVGEYPSVWGTKKCKLVGGNSGGPVFAKDNLMDVLGVLSKSTEAKMGGKDFSSLLLQVLNIGRARPNRATFAHAGCFDLPGWAAPDQRCKVLDENSVKQLSTGRKMKAISASLLEVSRQFLASPNAVVSVGKMRIKMSPMPVPVTGLDSQYSRKSGLVILPQPYCLLSGTADDVSRLDFSADVFILESNGRLSASESKLTGFWRLKRSGANWQHTLQADPMFSIFTFKMSESRAAELRDKGSEVSLGKCSGNEDEILLHELEKNLN